MAPGPARPTSSPTATSHSVTDAQPDLARTAAVLGGSLIVGTVIGATPERLFCARPEALARGPVEVWPEPGARVPDSLLMAGPVKVASLLARFGPPSAWRRRGEAAVRSMAG